MLEVIKIFKEFEGQPLLNGVTFAVDQGETVCLLGPSGSGKSTLLRIICGLEQADSGKILWQEKDLAGIPVHLRGFGLMFQDYALFPHKNVFENVAFGLKMQKLPKAEILEKVDSALKQVGMEGFSKRRVTDLSGGEQQRVAFARALAPRPRLLMLDEPLGALDRSLKEQLVQDLRRLLHETGIPAIYVTHDQEEAFEVGDRLLILHNGKIIQQGTPAEIYHRPVSKWVSEFFGMKNIVPGKVIKTDPVIVETEIGEFSLSGKENTKNQVGKRLTLLFAEDSARPGSKAKSVNCIRGKIVNQVFAGEGYRVTVSVNTKISLRFTLEKEQKNIQEINLHINPDGIRVLPE